MILTMVAIRNWIKLWSYLNKGSDKMIKRLNITIFGEVQGVFFRTNTQAMAKELGLTGWVRNETDGAVKILAEGDEEKLEKLIKYCQGGPKFAKVQRVEVKWEEGTGEFDGFEIKYD